MKQIPRRAHIPKTAGAAPVTATMGKLSAAQRKAIPKGDFAVPAKSPGSGSYPIEDASHARNALARSAGKPVAATVKAAVKRKYPSMGKPSLQSSMGSK